MKGRNRGWHREEMLGDAGQNVGLKFVKCVG